ncbi:beta-1,3-galactosyltransferase 1-like [Gastrophryne carolinensis]
MARDWQKEIFMGTSKRHRKCYVLFVLILLAYGYVLFFQEDNQPVIDPRILKENLNPRAILQPVNNTTFPTFRHPLVPLYPYPYKFILNHEDKCKGKNPFLILMVFSVVHDIESRIAVRDTWGNLSLYDVDVVRIFLVGLPKAFSKRIQMMLEEEDMLYGDIVQQDFLDTYYNLTLKTLMGMQWIMNFCPHASYAMKVDTDIFLNVDFLVHKLLHPDLPVRQNYFTGNIKANTRPIRDKAYKWYMPKEAYPNDTYPPYCDGPGYVFSADLAKKIYDVAQVVQVIAMEDAFMGICLNELRIPPTEPPPNTFFTYRINYDRCRFHNVISVHHYSKNELRGIWSNFWTNKTKGNHKMGHSIDVQCVAAPDLRFMSMMAGIPALPMTHISFGIPSMGVLSLASCLASFLVGGDFGYPLLPWLMTPIQWPHTQLHAVYNQAHMKARAVVERALLKTRFMCLDHTGGSIQYQPYKVFALMQTSDVCQLPSLVRLEKEDQSPGEEVFQQAPSNVRVQAKSAAHPEATSLANAGVWDM